MSNISSVKSWKIAVLTIAVFYCLVFATIAGSAITVTVNKTPFAIYGVMETPWPGILLMAPLEAGLSLLVYILLMRKLLKEPIQDFDRVYIWRELGLGIMVSTICMVGSVLIWMSLGYYKWNGIGLNNWVLIGVMLGLGPAVFEEIFFRGILLNRIYKKLGAFPAILISLGVFAAYHLPGVGSWQLGVGVLFGAGMMLTSLWFLTKRLWVTMAAHFTWNFLMVGVFGIPQTSAPLAARGLLNGELSGPMWLVGGNGSAEGSLPLIIFPFVISIIMFYIAWRRGDLRKPESDKINNIG